MPFEKVGVRATVEGVNAYVRDANRIERSTTGMSRSTRNTGRSFNVTTTQALRFGAALVGVQLGISVMSRSIIGLRDSTVGAALAFESSFAGIRKTMDLTEDQFATLSEANRGLAREIPVSVDEINRIGELAGQLGIRGVENVVAFEEAIAKIAITTDLTAESAALAFAQIANVLQLPQEQIENLASAIVGLGNNFATVESRIVNFTTRIAGAGAIVNLTAGDIAGIATAFLSAGAEAEAGGTAVQKVLLEMQAAVVEGGDQLDLFAAVAGSSAEEFARAFREDAGGVLVDFVEGLGLLGEDAVGVLTRLELQDQRLRRAFLSAAQAGDTLRRAIAQGNEEFEANNALSIEAEKRFETRESQLQLLQNRLRDVGLQAGEAVLEGLDPLIEATLEWLDTNADEFAEDLATAISGVVNTVTALIDVIQTLADFGPIELVIETAKGTVALLADFLGVITGAGGPPAGRRERVADLLAEQAEGLARIQAILGDPGERPAIFPGATEIELEQIRDRLADIRDELREIQLESREEFIPGVAAGLEEVTERLEEVRFKREQIEGEIEIFRITGEALPSELLIIASQLRLREEELERRLARLLPGPGEERPVPDIPPEVDEKAAARARKAFDRLLSSAERARERLQREALIQLDQFGALITDALRRRARTELDVELATISDIRDAHERALDFRLDQIREERDATLAAIRAETEAREDEISAELDGFREEEDAERLAQLERKRRLVFEAEDVFDADQRLRDFRRDQRRQELRDELGDVREAGRDREREAKDLAESEIEIARDEMEAELLLLAAREEAARNTFASITEDWRLESEARRLILEGENEAIAALLVEQGDVWTTAGLSFGEQLVSGIRSEIDAFIAERFAAFPGLFGGGGGGAGFVNPNADEIAELQAFGIEHKVLGAPDFVLKHIRDQIVALGGVPQFPHGGFVGSDGQRIPIMVEPGEVVLNPMQQQQLLAGGGGGTVFETGAFDGMFRGATLAGTAEENGREFARVMQEFFDEQLGRGAFLHRVDVQRR